MRPTLHLLKSSSSSRWIARQSKDPYVKSRLTPSGKNAQPAYRSRSSFKLVSLANKHPSLLGPNSFSNSSGRPNVIVDLGAAPGGWSQVVSQLTRGRARVFALDILGMEPIKGVEVIKGDFLSEGVREELKRRTERRPHDQDVAKAEGEIARHSDDQNEGMVDCVLSDMMAPMTGNKTRDIALSLQLCAAATVFARGVLRQAEEGEKVRKEGNKRVWPGGNLVIKFFAHPDMDEFRSLELDPWFGKVVVEKPKESRAESSEAYWVCLGYKGDPALR
ncbi:hypothetical protein I302_104813 [Kwoniella bestiolae CBS 10118]|uniref:rRNA methyltransferase 2, mitochondrial n=1 Tax=Kwoniella bestiolae CBS 10118 TaxID=1296100 RepID=A0A1B9FRN5_9TREE|nr:ribosomal RNA large subunit methyltransferase J [Kwoniella bestiolae CBS 10118]OCF21439.1 ribosomal RNA large subunit methyltransferase J [Kwoniella bestiolae CBS 10118]